MIVFVIAALVGQVLRMGHGEWCGLHRPMQGQPQSPSIRSRSSRKNSTPPAFKFSRALVPAPARSIQLTLFTGPAEYYPDYAAALGGIRSHETKTNIDANQYLKLYGVLKGKKLLDSLEEQKAYIFVSAQIVDEVLRNKLGCAQIFLSDKLKELNTVNAPVPDHLLGISDQETTDFRQIINQAKQARKKLDKLVADALLQISLSEDYVSKRLGALFDKAVPPSIDEMQRARERKERGNPPGKAMNPLGDQITWEQLLIHCKESKCTRLWIVTSDQDYCIEHQKRFLLNSVLTQNLKDACGVESEIHCSNNLSDGIRDFGKNAGVKAEKLLTAEEAAVIKKEIAALPPIGWLTDTDDAVRETTLFRHRMLAATDISFTPLPLAAGTTEAL